MALFGGTFDPIPPRNEKKNYIRSVPVADRTDRSHITYDLHYQPFHSNG